MKFNMACDEATNLLYYKSTWPKFAQDFKPQPGGKYSYFDATNYRFYIMDSTFTVVDSIEAANGYQTDSHEIRFLSDGNYVILALEEAKVDMSALVNGGDTAATVISDILQEFDHDKNLLFEWRTRDHFQVTDAAYENLLSPSIDFVHANSIELDHDTAYVLSCRNMDEVTKISRENGNIIWRWGGKHNQFTFVHDSLLFSHQHDVRILPNGNFTMFDNGNLHNTSTPASRAVEYSLDQESKIATKIWEYHHDPDIFGLAMGSTQRLTNGNTLICWGWCDSTAVTEVAPDGSTTFELRFPLGHYTYRAYKYTDAEIHAAVHNTESVTGSLELRQNFPNPVTGSTTISFHNSSQNQVTLTVFDALGREVKKLFNGIVDTGEYSEIFDSSPFPNGVYLITLQVGGKTSSKRLIISR